MRVCLRVFGKTDASDSLFPTIRDFEQIGQWNLQNACYLVQHSQRRIAHTSLHLADVGPIDLCFERKHFLRNALGLAYFP